MRQNFSWTFLGNVIYAACQWGILMVMAKVGTANMVGEFTLGLAITAPIYMFTNLQLSSVLSTDARSSHPFETYLGLRICTTIIALLSIILFVIIVHYKFETSLIIILIGISKGSESISDIIFGLLQKNERMDKIAISLIIKGITSLSVLCLLLWITENIILSIIGFVVSWIIILLMYDFPNSRHYTKNKPNFHVVKLWPLIRISIPMGLVMMLISLNSNIPRYFIQHYLGTESVGYFAALSYVMIAGNTVVSALGQSASPRLSRFYSDFNLKSFRTLMIKLALLGSVIGILGYIISILFSKEILNILYKSNYANYYRVFELIMFGAGISYVASFLGYGMTAARKFKIQPLLFIFITIISIISNAILIPLRGLEGASFALIVTYLFQLIISIYIIVFVILKGNKKLSSTRE